MDVILDGNDYEGCKFELCRLITDCSNPGNFKNCGFHVNCTWHFTGAAARTVATLTNLYAAGGAFSTLVDRTIDCIRGVPNGDSGDLLLH